MNDVEKNSILIVDDEKANILALTHILNEEYTILAAKDGMHAIKAVETHKPDLILLDILMPEMDGYAVMAKLKGSEATQNIPIIFITGLTDDDDEEKALALGAADYISKPFSPATVRLRVRNQIQILNQLLSVDPLTIDDHLTGLLSRRSFDSRARIEWKRSIKNNAPISVILADIDNLKEYNIAHGHQCGDAVIVQATTIIMQTLGRPSDFVTRWGDEEFIALLPDTDENVAWDIAESLRKNIETATIHCDGDTVPGVTVSIGVNTQIPVKDSSLKSFIAMADDALHNAKTTGKNRVCPA